MFTGRCVVNSPLEGIRCADCTRGNPFVDYAVVGSDSDRVVIDILILDKSYAGCTIGYDTRIYLAVTVGSKVEMLRSHKCYLL